jgi:peptidoglycan/LPS O-acetylase OafA/YrhL
MAILLVLGRHAEYYHLWQRAGWIGVDLFFVLSGFLISNLLFSEYGDTGTINLGRFLLRRGLKIYPAYYFFVLFALALCLDSLRLPGSDPGVPRNASADHAWRCRPDHQLHASQV